MKRKLENYFGINENPLNESGRENKRKINIEGKKKEKQQFLEEKQLVLEVEWQKEILHQSGKKDVLILLNELLIYHCKTCLWCVVWAVLDHLLIRNLALASPLSHGLIGF